MSRSQGDNRVVSVQKMSEFVRHRAGRLLSLEVGTGVDAIVAHTLMRQMAANRGPALCTSGKVLPADRSKRGRPSIWCAACKADNRNGAALQRKYVQQRKSE